MGRGYVGQIFNSIQGEGLYVGRRQVFVRFAGCSLRCLYCDTDEFRKSRPRTCEVEIKPGSMKFRRVQNPMTREKVLGYVRRLRTPDTHSVSLTGGEPLLAVDFLIDVARSCKGAGFATYLETNGADSEAMRKVAKYIDIAAIDIKLPEHGAMRRKDWPSLLREELECVKIALGSGLKTFVKIVVLPSTKPGTITQVCSRLTQVPVVIQPVTPSGSVHSAPSMAHVYHLAQAAAMAGVKEIAIIPQVHKLMKVL